MNTRQEIAFVAYCLAKGKGALAADELVMLSSIGTRFIKVGDTVQQASASMSSIQFTGTVTERVDDDRIRIQLTEPTTIVQDGYETVTNTVVVPIEAVELAPAVADGDGTGGVVV